MSATRSLLADRGLEWPAPIHHLESVGSTNDWLKERARQGAPAWTAVMADVQTAGRGRQGRAWVSQAGDLFLSVLVRPSLAREWLTLLPLAAGVAVAEAVSGLGAEVALKWPNDVVVPARARPGGEPVGYRKLAGILVEGVSEGPELVAAVIGIGLNLVLAESEAPPELAARVVSLRAACGRDVPREEAAAAVLQRLTVWYDALAREDAGAVVEAWSARALPWWGRTVEVRSGETVLCGTARGIDGRGALLLDLEDGSSVAVVSGEARQLRLDARG